MKCQRCNKNEATTYIKRNINGNITETALCTDCAKETGQIDMNFGFTNLFSNLFADFAYPSMGVIGEAVTCPVCHSTFDDIARTGKVGCAKCYEVFSNQLIPTIRDFQRKTIHSGKRPDGKSIESNSVKEPSEKEKLEAELKNAIETQNFEYAAELRDKIKALGESEGK